MVRNKLYLLRVAGFLLLGDKLFCFWLDSLEIAFLLFVRGSNEQAMTSRNKVWSSGQGKNAAREKSSSLGMADSG